MGRRVLLCAQMADATSPVGRDQSAYLTTAETKAKMRLSPVVLWHVLNLSSRSIWGLRWACLTQDVFRSCEIRGARWPAVPAALTRR